VKQKYFIDFTASIFILLFSYTAVSKIIGFELFYIQLTQSEIIAGFAGVVAVGVPAIEILIVVLLLMNTTRLAGLYMSMGLMAAFIVYIIAITRFSFHTPCSCGGVLELLSWDAHLIMNVVLLIMAGAAVWIYPLPSSGSEKIAIRDLL
jgi:hypothetical protein